MRDPTKALAGLIEGNRAPAAAPERRVNGSGYAEVKVAGRWRLEHRVVVEGHLGRRLKASEVVHHANEAKGDNRPGNLMVFPSDAQHRRYHEGRTARMTWDGRTIPTAAPATPATGPTLRQRVLKVAPVRWRELAWLQGDLKGLSPVALAHLKESLKRQGVAAPFHVWEHESKVWILDGHQRRRALAELEAEGYALPDELPGVFLDCANRKEAAELVLMFASVAGRVDEDRLLEFSGTEDLNEALAGLLDTLDLPGLDGERLKDDLSPKDLAERLEQLTADSRPAPRLARLTPRDWRAVTAAAAVLNRMGYQVEVEEDGKWPGRGTRRAAAPK